MLDQFSKLIGVKKDSTIGFLPDPPCTVNVFCILEKGTAKHNWQNPLKFTCC
ncbi:MULTISPECIES: hypothetical protein [Bacillales]|uniref:hypothetical protein n=1 Tax=Bacillales TaxID=1385 RepID=UPI0003635D17|nr:MULTISPECIES: hypothetical protein [Bacillales]